MIKESDERDLGLNNIFVCHKMAQPS